VSRAAWEASLDKFISARVSRFSIIDRGFDFASLQIDFRGRGTRHTRRADSKPAGTANNSPSARGSGPLFPGRDFVAQLTENSRVVFPAALRRVLAQVSNVRALGRVGPPRSPSPLSALSAIPQTFSQRFRIINTRPVLTGTNASLNVS